MLLVKNNLPNYAWAVMTAVAHPCAPNLYAVAVSAVYPV
jgi:hypothetical protein